VGQRLGDGNDGVLRFFVVEALEWNIDLSLHFDAADWIEEQFEDTDEHCDIDGRRPVDDITKEQTADLQAVVRAAIREWQVRHGLPLRSWVFAATRNEEVLAIEPPEKPELAAS
jgi:hypothetical protein